MAILWLVTCTPIDYQTSDYSAASIEEVKTKDTMWSVEKGSKNAIVSFSPLECVDSYSIILSQEGGDYLRSTRGRECNGMVPGFHALEFSK